LAVDYGDYRDAFVDLVGRLGSYCTYCERRIPTNLAVEHIQPKKLPEYEHLKGRWENFLLGCVNCNSTKGKKDVVLSLVLLPDRDNTAAAYIYTQDGRMEVEPGLTPVQRAMAVATLVLTGLEKGSDDDRDSNGELVALDRVAQRMECWLTAQESKADLLANPSLDVRRLIVKLAMAEGNFSIWMAVFHDDPAQRLLFIEHFPGTATDCYHADTSVVTPRPPNGLPDGGKL
jgi:uncharacterized protein (TIGR02646 family)